MSFEEARKVLEKQYFDALIMEQEIAGQSAVDFCIAVQGRYPEMAFIVMVDWVTRELVEAAQRGIVDGYIHKPISISSILEALKNV